MNTTKYLFLVAGEDPNKITKWHKSTINRTKTFGMAIHIPVLLWAITGYVISTSIFNLNTNLSLAIAALCSCLIYLIERIVIHTPKNRYVTLFRVLIGSIIAILGASAVDLVVFDKEVTYQLKKTEENRIIKTYENQLKTQITLVAQKKNEWFAAQEKADCEANGRCGSGIMNLGPRYRALKNHSDILHNDYKKAQATYENLLKDKDKDIENALSSVSGESGILARVESLHQYIKENRLALVAYILFLGLIFLFELMVIISKVVFDETIDDLIEKTREDIAKHNAASYRELVMSPFLGATNSIRDAFSN